MIEWLKHDDIIRKCGGRFKLTALIQKRWLELMRGAPPLTEGEGLNQLELTVKEIVEDKIEGQPWDDESEEPEDELEI